VPNVTVPLEPVLPGGAKGRGAAGLECSERPRVPAPPSSVLSPPSNSESLTSVRLFSRLHPSSLQNLPMHTRIFREQPPHNTLQASIGDLDGHLSSSQWRYPLHTRGNTQRASVRGSVVGGECGEEGSRHSDGRIGGAEHLMRVEWMQCAVRKKLSGMHSVLPFL
jgi:hypothetical protein